jgi:acyl-coenzyme A synthetase/AMP-(fatty) acid ligase
LDLTASLWYWLDYWNAEAPTNVLLDDRLNQWSYGQMHDLVLRCSSFLRRLGLSTGSIVALDVPAPLHVVTSIALERLGCTTAAYPTLLVQEGFVFDLLLSTTVTSSPIARHTWYLDDTAMTALAATEPDREPPVATRASEKIRLVFSSGSTGSPKAVATTMRQAELRRQQAFEYEGGAPSSFCGVDFSAWLGFRDLYGALRRGGAYLTPGVASHNLHQITRHKIENVLLSPDQMRTLLDEIDRTETKIDSVKRMMVVGGALSDTLVNRILQLPGVAILNLYGSTECGAVAARMYSSTDSTNVGKVVRQIELEIVDEQGNALPPGATGVIRYRKDGEATEYFRNPEVTAQFFKEGWFYPGDLGYLSEEEELHIVGRANSSSNVGGIKVDPSRYDDVAKDVIGVTDAAGLVIDIKGEPKLALCVVKTFGFDEKDLLRIMEQGFGSAGPSLVIYVETIPRGGMGKVSRSELSRLVAKQLGD